MAFIYKITNLINNKSYIGLTTRLVETRWKEHLRGTQDIDNAIIEYGKDNFIIETIEECSEEEVDDREIYWINYYDTFNNGYNRTNGGRDNKMIFTNKVNEVLELWNSGLTVNRIVEQTHLNVETVRGYLNKNGIDHDQIKKRANIFIGKAKAKPIVQFDSIGNVIKIWESFAEIKRTINLSKKKFYKAVDNNILLNNCYWKRLEKCQDIQMELIG